MISIFGLIQLRDPSLPSISFASDCLSTSQHTFLNAWTWNSDYSLFIITDGSEVNIADPPAKKFIVPGLADIIGTNKPSEIVSDEGSSLVLSIYFSVSSTSNLGQCLYSLDNSTVLADKCGSAVSPDSDPGRFFTFPSSQDLFQYLLP